MRLDFRAFRGVSNPASHGHGPWRRENSRARGRRAQIHKGRPHPRPRPRAALARATEHRAPRVPAVNAGGRSGGRAPTRWPLGGIEGSTVRAERRLEASAHSGLQAFISEIIHSPLAGCSTHTAFSAPRSISRALGPPRRCSCPGSYSMLQLRALAAVNAQSICVDSNCLQTPRHCASAEGDELAAKTVPKPSM